MGEIDDAIKVVEDAVTENDTVDGSAVTLIDQLAGLIEANKNAPAKLQALADRLRAANSALSAAVVANTPAAPPA